MQQYESGNYKVVLINPGIKSYHHLALLILIFNLAVFIFLLFSDKYFYTATASLFLVGIYLFIRFYFAKKNNTKFFIDVISFFILAGCWLALSKYMIALGSLLVGVLYYFSLQKIVFVFNNTCVKKLNFPPVVYTWNKFSNIILKDTILTLDFNNNKLIQCEIETSINEKKFNEFVQQQLIKFSHNEENLYLN